MIGLKQTIDNYLMYCENQKKMNVKSIKAYTIDLEQLWRYTTSENIPNLFATGLRVSELCSLNAEYIDLGNGSILIMGKGAKERVLQICSGIPSQHYCLKRMWIYAIYSVCWATVPY